VDIHPSEKKDLFKDEFMELFTVAPFPKETIETFKHMFILIALRHKQHSVWLSRKAKDPERKVKQVIILGSGFDTRPVRKKAYPFKYFEVDMQENLEDKKRYYTNHKVDPNAVYIGMDYVKEDLIKKFVENGVNLTLGTHFIWEGNCIYLPLEAIFNVWNTITSNFKGYLSLSMDYPSVEFIKSTVNDANLKEGMKQRKSPFITGFDSVNDFSNPLGFNVIENFVIFDLAEHYKITDKFKNEPKQHYIALLERTNK